LNVLFFKKDTNKMKSKTLDFKKDPEFASRYRAFSYYKATKKPPQYRLAPLVYPIMTSNQIKNKKNNIVQEANRNDDDIPESTPRFLQPQNQVDAWLKSVDSDLT
jgi:hypothetical protein